MKMGNCILQTTEVFNCRYMLENRSDRFDAILLNLGLIHAAGVIVAHLLFRTSLRCILVCCCLVEDFMKNVAVLFLKDLGDAPTWKSSRDRIRREPAAIRILIKICARRRFLIEAREVEAMTCLTKNCSD